MSFWDYTIGELKLIIDNYVNKKEEELKGNVANNYTIASLTASFVGSVLSGNEIPTLSEVYPDLFKEEQKEEEIEDKSWMLYKEQFIDFANAHNKHIRLIQKDEE